MEAAPAGESQFEAFKRLHRAANAAFRRGEIEEAWGGVPEEFEFHLPAGVPEMPEEGVLRGRAEVIRYMQSLREGFPDWGGEPQEYIDFGEGRFFIHMRMTGTGGRSGLSGAADMFQVWEVRNGVAIRMREFTDRADAERVAQGERAEDGR